MILLKPARRLPTERRVDAGAPVRTRLSKVLSEVHACSDRRFKIMLFQAVQERGGNVPWSGLLHHLKGKWHLRTIQWNDVGACAHFYVKFCVMAAGDMHLAERIRLQCSFTTHILIPSSGCSKRLSHLHLADALIVRNWWGVRTRAESCSETHRQWQREQNWRSTSKPQKTFISSHLPINMTRNNQN